MIRQAGRARTRRFARSLSARFLMVVVPFMIICFVTVIGVFQWFLYRDAYQELPRKLEVILASRSLILGEAVAERDLDKIGLIIASAVADPDVTGVAVYDMDDRPLDIYGSGLDQRGELLRRTGINHIADDGFRQVGWLEVAMTDAMILRAVRRSLSYQVSVAIILLVIAVIGSILAFRSTIGAPISRLMLAIREVENAGVMRPVDWSSDDELGEMIHAYNTMLRNRLAVERDLVQAKEMAEVASRAKSEFLANMSHELRTPLNSIIGFADVIRGEMLGPNHNPKYRGYAEGIHQSGHHLLAIMQDILDISRIEAGHVTLEEDAVDLAAVYQSCKVMIGHRAAAQQIRLSERFPADLPDLLADQRHLKQVLVNLLSNAVKFTQPGGRITTSARLGEDGSIILSVADTGIGIAEEHRATLFEPFTQVANSQARSHEGSGLGLAICHSLVTMHGGTIGIESALGQGTEVIVRFPRARTITPA